MRCYSFNYWMDLDGGVLKMIQRAKFLTWQVCEGVGLDFSVSRVVSVLQDVALQEKADEEGRVPLNWGVLSSSFLPMTNWFKKGGECQNDARLRNIADTSIYVLAGSFPKCRQAVNWHCTKERGTRNLQCCITRSNAAPLTTSFRWNIAKLSGPPAPTVLLCFTSGSIPMPMKLIVALVHSNMTEVFVYCFVQIHSLNLSLWIVYLSYRLMFHGAGLDT